MVYTSLFIRTSDRMKKKKIHKQYWYINKTCKNKVTKHVLASRCQLTPKRVFSTGLAYCLKPNRRRRHATVELSRVGGVNAPVCSRRELVANCVRTADANATRLDSCVGIGIGCVHKEGGGPYFVTIIPADNWTGGA